MTPASKHCFEHANLVPSASAQEVYSKLAAALLPFCFCLAIPACNLFYL